MKLSVRGVYFLEGVVPENIHTPPPPPPQGRPFFFRPPKPLRGEGGIFWNYLLELHNTQQNFKSNLVVVLLLKSKGL